MCRFAQRRAAQAPGPRLHGIRVHGVLAPNAELWPVAVPKGPPARAHVPAETAPAAECAVERPWARPLRISRVRLLKRVSDIEMQGCPPCGAGRPKTIGLKWPLCRRAMWAPRKA